MNSGRSVFRLLCGLAALAALAMIGSNVAVILVRGAKSLPEALTQPETLFALVTSLKTASISTVLCFVLAVPTAYLLTRTEFPGRAAVEMLLELTLSLPYIVLGVSLLILFSSPAGKALKAAGLPVVFSQNGIVLAQLTVNLPFAVQLASTAFRRADRKLEYVAGLLGAGEARRFFTILLPLCRHSLAGALVLVWSRALGEFGATLMLVGVTRMKTETLPANIYLNVSANDLDGALASAFLLLVISAASLAVASRFTRVDKRWGRYV